MLKMGIFGGLFDFNGDGELDIVERAVELAALDELTSEKEDSDDEEFDDLELDDDDLDSDDFDF